MDLPEEVGYGTITGRILAAVRDEDDLNLAPDGAPVRGQAIFTPSIDYATVDSAATGPQTIAFAPIIGVFDDQGYLSTPHPNSGQVMYRGLNLVATDDPDLSVTGWTWRVAYQLEAVAGKKLVIPEHSFEVPVGSSLDLAELVPVPSTPGYGLPQAEAAALRAEAVAQSVRDDADSGVFNGLAATVVVGTVTNGDNPSVTNTGTGSHAVLNFVLAKGDKGDTGIGLPDSGSPLQVMRMAESGAQTEWVSPDKIMVGLGNVDNTADLGKPVSNATQSALNLKASTSDLTAGLLEKADLQSGKVPVAQLPTDALVTDANVAAQVNGAQTGPAIDARINTQVTPQVEQIASDYIASQPAVVDAAAAAVDANPKVALFQAAIQGAGIAENLIVNGSFRDGLNGWGTVGAWLPQSNGVTSWARATSGADRTLKQLVAVPAYMGGQALRLTARAWSTSTGSLVMYATPATGIISVEHTLALGDAVYTLDVPVPETQGSEPIVIDIGRSNGSVYMTAIRLEAI